MKHMGTHVHVPNGFVDIVRPCPCTKFGSIASQQVLPFLLFKGPHSTGEQPGSNQVEQTGGKDEKDLKFRGRSTP